MKALLLDASERTGVVTDIPVPVPTSNEVLIRVRAVALNPVDALYTAHPLGCTGRVIGSDFAGVVTELGSAVPSSSIQPNCRVAGFLQGACSINDRPGAFAEFLVCPWDLVWQIGDLSFEEAASVSLCALTAAQALYLRLGVPAPFPYSKSNSSEPPTSIFINGSTTSVGLYAAQLARRAHSIKKLVGSASPKHFAMLRVKPYLYDAVVNYRSADWPEQVIVASGNNGTNIAFDCISEGSSVLNTNRTLRKNSDLDSRARMAVVRSRAGAAWDYTQEQLNGIEPSYGAVWEGLGADVEYAGMTLPANAEMRAFTVQFYQWLSKEGLVSNTIRLMPGGLEAIVRDGFRLLGSGSMENREAREEEAWMRQISAEKLVYTIE